MDVAGGQGQPGCTSSTPSRRSSAPGAIRRLDGFCFALQCKCVYTPRANCWRDGESPFGGRSWWEGRGARWEKGPDLRTAEILGLAGSTERSAANRYRLAVMDTGVTGVGEVATWLRRDRRRVWVRALVGPSEIEGERSLRFAELLVGPRPDGWERRSWRFPGWTFDSAEIAARELAVLLESVEAKGCSEIRFKDEVASFTLGGGCQWFRLASRQEYDRVELQWPSRHVNIAIGDGLAHQPAGYLVQENGPSFPTFASAFGAFFYDLWAQTGAIQPNLGQIKLRIVDGQARIRRVVVGAASADVWVDGRGVRGCQLELNSGTERREVELTKRGKYTFPLPNGLGDEPWFWLKSGSGWIDYRSLTPWGGRAIPGVEFDVPEDPLAEVTALATQGESSHLEYKATLPDDNQTSKRKILKTVVAFANGDGGTMLFGVDGDDFAGTVVGLTGKPAQLLRRLNDLVRDCVSPAPRVSASIHEIDGKQVIRLNVGSGAGVLHALMLDVNRPEYYVRRNGSTYHARPEELVDVIARGPQPTAGQLFRLG